MLNFLTVNFCVMKKTLLTLLILSQLSFSQNILDLKSRAEVIKDLQKDRLENLLPDLMEETIMNVGLITREYNEDPIIKTLLPPTWLNARRRTILVFFN